MITFRPYQRKCMDAFYDYYATGNGGHGVIVVPTAGGKSLIIGGLISEICQRWTRQRILLLSHVRELIAQNHSKILTCWPTAPAGIYSASLGKRQAHHPIVSATIQSVYKKSAVLGHRDLVFIDEAHLLNSEGTGMYNELIAQLMEINPALKVCGFTATDYRLDSGPLTDGKLFDDIIIEINIKTLLAEGYLTPPIGKQSLIQADMEGVKITAGEYNIKQMAERFDQLAFINKALDNDLQFLEGRRSIALFSATIENAKHLAAAMIARGIECEVIDGTMAAEQRDDILDRFRTYRLRAVASVGVITTGTDMPNMDAILLFRATQSTGLFQQIIGRGFRVIYGDGFDLATSEGRLSAIGNGPKPNFLVLDHGGNVERHGPITCIQKPEKREKGERRKVEKPKAKICEICRTAWPLEVTICGLCKHQMVSEKDAIANLNVEASGEEILGTPFSRSEAPQWFAVENVSYFRHIKAGAPDSMRVTYYCGIMQFNEWIALQSPYPGIRHKALNWWNNRGGTPFLGTQDDKKVTFALKNFNTLKKPLRILVKKKERFYEILQHDFHELLDVVHSA